MSFQNAAIPEPAPPGPWVNDVDCICGDHLADYDDDDYYY